MIKADGIHLQTVFEHIGDALGILITLDHIFAQSGTLREHWKQYKRCSSCYSFIVVVVIQLMICSFTSYYLGQDGWYGNIHSFIRM